jgi:capsule polysaccharide export protein KpsE/RkpR
MLESPEDQEIMLAATRDVPDLDEHNSDTPLLAIVRLLWVHRIWLGKVVLVGLLVSAVITLLVPASFEGTVQLMPPDNSANSGMAMMGLMMGGGGAMGGASGGLASGLGELLGGSKQGTLFIGVLSSRTIADRIIDRFDLRKVYWRKTYLSTRKQLASNTEISEDKKTGIIKIVVSDHDRVRATAMAQAYVEELNRLLAQVNTSSASRERAFLEQRLSMVHQELQDSAKELAQFSSRNSTLDPQAQGKAMVEATVVLQGQLIAAQSELSGLEQIYTSDNVRVRSLRAHVAELQSQLNKIGGKNYTGSSTLDPDALYPSLRQLPIMALQYAELYRRVKIDETVFELLTKACELAKVQEAKETPSVKVLDAAQVPEKKSGPPRTLLTLLGGFLTLLFATCWVIGSELWSEVDPNEPHRKFLEQAWAEAKPFFREKRSHLFSGMSRIRGGNGSSRESSDGPQH